MNNLAQRASEDGTLAAEMAKAFGRMLNLYQEHVALSREDAAARLAEIKVADAEGNLANPPDQISWVDLHFLSQADSGRGKACWETIQRAALEELRIGHRAAQAVETINDGPWQRAQFLAIREDLSAEWQPRNGIERQLLDTMAQAQVALFHWTVQLTAYCSLETVSGQRQHREEGRWQAPRQSDADAMRQAAEMIDRFNRIFLRTLRALRDLRRYDPTVIVKKGGQLNVAEQQVIVASNRQS
jgi:hypothetical protein